MSDRINRCPRIVQFDVTVCEEFYIYIFQHNRAQSWNMPVVTKS